MRLAAQDGRKILKVSVDKVNRFARRLYDELGFSETSCHYFYGHLYNE